jgi:hypothetical protein
MEGAHQLCLLHYLAPSTVTSGIWPPPVPMNMNETQVKVYANIDRLTIGHPISPIFTDSPHAYNTMLPSRNQTWQWKSLHS